MKKRIDQWLVEKGLASSRTQAQDLINNKQVRVYKNGLPFPVEKANHSFLLTELENQLRIEILPGTVGKYVSRGGLKLEGALDHVGLNVKDFIALDVGVSTGGFSEVLLKRGAAQVFGLDVGHGQTHERLKSDPRFKLFEGVNIKDMDDRLDVSFSFPALGFDLVVIDVSFIRLELVWPKACGFLKVGGKLLSLIKPQFELGPSALGKNGIVKNEELYSLLHDNMIQLAQRLGLQKLDYFESSIQGKEGNREFFIFASKI